MTNPNSPTAGLTEAEILSTPLDVAFANAGGLVLRAIAAMKQRFESPFPNQPMTVRELTWRSGTELMSENGPGPGIGPKSVAALVDALAGIGGVKLHLQ